MTSDSSNSRDRKPSNNARPPRSSGKPSSGSGDRSGPPRGSRPSNDRTGRGDGGRGGRSDRPSEYRGRAEDRERRESPRDRTPPPDEFADVDIYVLSREVRKDLEGLSDVNQERVAKLLAAARIALDEEDFERAFELTQRAAKSAGRVAVVREAAGIAAYQVGNYAVAKKELQAARRIAGRNDLIPMLADCERALRDPERAIALAETPEARALRGADQAELILVVSGARRDLGQLSEATSMLAAAATQTPEKAAWAARLYYAYADALADSGESTSAREWFAKSAMADSEGDLNGNERMDELDSGS